MSMIYFTNDTIDFLQGLAENNNASWFNNNKRLFEERVKMPFQNFIEDVCQELEKFENLPMAAPKDCIFRLNRDTRFSEDKSPYKTFVSALVSPFGRQNKAYPGMYIQISGSEVRLYSGSHDLTPEQLKFVRQKIYDEPKKFERIISDKEFIRVFREIKGKKSKKISPPFSELIDVVPQIANKEFYCFTEIPVEMILQAKFKNVMMKKYSACRDLNLFLREGLKSMEDRIAVS